MPVALLPHQLNRLRSLTDFPALLAYLRDDLDWPLEDYGLEDLTFDYTPQELGLKEEYAVKIRSIRQIRPLASGQPWGVFFLEFEPKCLPVAALRRILSALVPRKRAGANAAGRSVWDKHDLLFISAMGEQSHRRLSFAHFKDADDGQAVLETFDWDDTETQFNAIGASLDRLRWPDYPDDEVAWRAQWAAAFTRPHQGIITSAQALSMELALLAARTRDRVVALYDVERLGGPLHGLFDAFKTALVHDLQPKTFADMVAQTVAYGLFTARAETGRLLGLTDLALLIPATNPFLRELFAEIEALGGPEAGGLNFNDLGVSEIVTLLNDAPMEDILADFGRQTGGGQEDPVVHFYEDFLKAYDAAQRVERGVFYTPKPVVSFIVRSVDRILRDEFGLADGLADTTTWGEMQVKHPGLTLPEGVSPDAPFVQILDPATGTGTFLEEVIDVIWRTLCVKWRAERKTEAQILALWNEYVPRHLLPRLNGFELMMASYAIAHVKLGLKLKQTGYNFGSGERLRVYLTNTLEEPDELGSQRTMASAFHFLAHESRAADAVKRDTPITVVVGNPPYSGHSANKGGWVTNLLRSDLSDGAHSYFEIDGQPLGERNPKWLNDDYVKFIRYGQFLLARTGTGVLGFITNHGYLDNPTFRGMRRSLMASFPEVRVLDLHGNAKKKERDPDSGGVDDNVFDIQQGVAIGLFVKPATPSGASFVHHTHLYGPRDHKYGWLTETEGRTIPFTPLAPTAPFALFMPQDQAVRAEYEQGKSVIEIFNVNVLGFQTHRDHFAIDFDETTLRQRVSAFRGTELTDDETRQKFHIADNRDWQITRVRTKLRDCKDWERYFTRCLYRPFDIRPCYFSELVMDYPRRELIRNVFGHSNLNLLVPRQLATEGWLHSFCSRVVPESCVISTKTKEQNYVFPLFRYPAENEVAIGLEREANLNPQFVAELTQLLAKMPKPEDIFHYIYAIFYSPTYRSRYAEFLKIDFPRLPLTSAPALFRQLAALGAELTALHLMETIGRCPAAFPVPGGNAVEGRPRYVPPNQSAGEGRAYINTTQYFAPVSPEVWAFQIGGYQVCEKWLKDRKGRVLTAEDITHYGRIVAALGDTIRLVGEIDTVIDDHGGWPLG